MQLDISGIMFRNIIHQSCLLNDFCVLGVGRGAYSKIAAFEGSRGITVYITSINVHLYRNIRTFLGNTGGILRGDTGGILRGEYSGGIVRGEYRGIPLSVPHGGA